MRATDVIPEPSWYLVLLAALVAYLLACRHLWDALKWSRPGQEQDRAFRNRVGLWFLAIAVVLSVALLVSVFGPRSL
jgi:uncharacterized membrane protein